MTLSNNIFLRRNIQCLKYNEDENELLIFLKSLPNQPQVLSLFETRVSQEHYPYDYNIEGYQPIESKHRKNVKLKSVGVAINVENGVEFRPVLFAAEQKCKILENTFQ